MSRKSSPEKWYVTDGKKVRGPFTLLEIYENIAQHAIETHYLVLKSPSENPDEKKMTVMDLIQFNLDSAYALLELLQTHPQEKPNPDSLIKKNPLRNPFFTPARVISLSLLALSLFGWLIFTHRTPTLPTPPAPLAILAPLPLPASTNNTPSPLPPVILRLAPSPSETHAESTPEPYTTLPFEAPSPEPSPSTEVNPEPVG